MKKLFFIGSGKMATAIAGGLISSGTFSADELGAFDPSSAAAECFQKITGIKVISDDPASGISDAEAILVAVKPQMIVSALSPYKELLKDKLLISIAAGVSIDKLQEISGCRKVVRVMPNTPALVGKGAAAYASSEKAGDADEKLAEKIFSSVGIALKMRECDLDAVTALSGSGPAYVFEFIQALADGGVAEGLSRDAALMLAVQTVIGAAEMVVRTGEHPAGLKDKVTSPAGTTSRALEELESRSFTGTVIKAVRAAAARSRELGKC
ncbi:MAG: pyrroline-5-carboxylate reductase [Lentisphaeria bacterium]|nr:pyrroline-5-carboxylate reductase [Lentisphaerota bacterium]MBR2625862.1 pyrroline-5-carboxylate reductase [Lentisphaeria bacterium]